MKILITGGHLTPALAMVDYVQSLQVVAEFVFVGRTHSRADQVGVEATEVAQRQIKFIPFTAPKFALVAWWRLPGRLWDLLLSVGRAGKIVAQEKPDVVLVFGGYLAVPIVIAAWLQRIPIVTHEQTRTVGLANRLIGRLATKVAVAFTDSQRFFATTKTQVTGNPIRAALFRTDLPAPSWFQNPDRKPLLVITGGSQGSQAINEVVDQILPQLLPNWCVVHQRGPHTQLPASTFNQSPNYFPRPWLSDIELFWFWQQPECVSLSRAGANTVTELAAVAVPAILIPLPFSYQDEQRANAEWLASAGGAVLLEQANLTSTTLLQTLGQVQKQSQAMHTALAKLALSTDATAQLWQLLQLVTRR